MNKFTGDIPRVGLADYRLIDRMQFEPKLPKIQTVEHAGKTLEDIRKAMDTSKPFGERLKAFIRGENALGRKAGVIADFATIFIPWGSKVDNARDLINSILNKKQNTMPKRIKPYITQKSTWEGIAAVLGAIGIVIYPAAIIEIVAGVFLIIGGIELWKEESEEE